MKLGARLFVEIYDDNECSGGHQFSYVCLANAKSAPSDYGYDSDIIVSV